ncbi:Os03g0578300, partial [Oryza sativa Japonica Group]
SILIGPRSPLNLQGIGLLHDNSCLMLILGEATHYAQLMDLQEWSCQHLIDKQIQGRSIFVNALAILEYEGHLREKYKY